MGERIKIAVSGAYVCLFQPQRAGGQALPTWVLIMELLWEGQRKALVLL